MKVRDNKIFTILNVDLTTGEIEKNSLPESWTTKYLGCRGVNSKLLFDNIQPGIDPLSPENILLVGTGPLNGLPGGMGRLSVACKSPRGTIAEGSLGGFFATELRRAGIDFLMIKGKADRPTYLYIDDGKIELRNAKHLWGFKTDEVDAALRVEIPDPDFQFLYIGPAGENLVHSSVIIGNLKNSGGRAGCGEVMGSKKLKAIAARGRGGIRVARYQDFLSAYRQFNQKIDILQSRDRWVPGWSTYGAAMLARIFQGMGNQMTRNAQEMSWDEQKAIKIGAENYLEKYVIKAKVCDSCPWPACQKLHKIPSGKFQGYKGGDYEGGQAVALGSLLDNDDLDLVLVLSGMCNQYGLDVFHVGYTIAWAMECFEKGILLKSDTDGLELRFGCKDQAGLVELVRKIALKQGFGELLAKGCARASRIIGKDSERFALCIKDQELEGIGQRNMYMVALGLAVSEVGPDHTRWYPPYPCNPNLMTSDELRGLGIEFDLYKAFDGRNPDEKGKMLRWFTISRAIVESLPSCVYMIRDTLGLDLHPWWNLFKAATGADLDYAEFVKVGERVLNLDRLFNVREGYRRSEDYPPYRMVHEDVKYFGFSKLSSDIFDPMLDEYYSANEWDIKTSIPTVKKLSELGLVEEMKNLAQYGVEIP